MFYMIPVPAFFHCLLESYTFVHYTKKQRIP